MSNSVMLGQKLVRSFEMWLYLFLIILPRMINAQISSRKLYSTLKFLYDPHMFTGCLPGMWNVPVRESITEKQYIICPKSWYDLGTIRVGFYRLYSYTTSKVPRNRDLMKRRNIFWIIHVKYISRCVMIIISYFILLWQLVFIFKGKTLGNT